MTLLHKIVSENPRMTKVSLCNLGVKVQSDDSTAKVYTVSHQKIAKALLNKLKQIV